MSLVTNVLLIAASFDGRGVDDISVSNGQKLARVDEEAGGSCYMECAVWAAGFNYLDDAELLAAIERLEWEYPECVQLLIKHQDDDKFTDVPLKLRLRDGS